jgi:hypothetical protein
VFGLKGDVKNNITYLDELNIIYPAGNNAVIYNTENKSQRFLPLAEQLETVTALCLSQNKKLLAVGLRSPERASVAIYDIQTLRKRKTITFNDLESHVSLIKTRDELILGFR